jgi:predicted transposase/invertase (TIGR01784 family)
MRRDTIFYALFQQSPGLLFELLEEKPFNAGAYRFDSVAVKEPKFEIDGVFLPPEDPGVVYFCEVQFQKDERLYERMFGESFLYFYRNRERFTDWQAVVIYPTRATEQEVTHPYQALLESERFHRVYLDELGEMEELPLGVALMALTTVAEERAPEVARALMSRARQEDIPVPVIRRIMEMIATIMVYKFTNLSRQEVDAMLGSALQETRVYREAQEEAGQLLVSRQLRRRFGELPSEVVEQISGLSLDQLGALGEALLDFQSIADLDAWLASLRTDSLSPA